jgi:oxygen-independent coproporphyrinogen-3 oxidase
LFNEEAYINALLADFQQDVQLFLLDQASETTNANVREIETIFIGGGTPSLFSGEAFQKLLNGIRDMTPLSSNVEITLEANPGSAEQARFEIYRQSGINRLSIGTQSYNQSHLKRIGRVHDREEAINAAHSARSAGFSNFNIDLMFALPEQSINDAILDVETAINLKPTHLSCYQLTLEPNTEFHRNPPKLPKSDEAWEMQSAIQTKLSKAHFNQYEVSAYAKEHKQCQHNLNYWQFGDYLGIGAGAHGKITDNHGNISRYWKQKHPKNFLNNAYSEKRFGDNFQVDSEQLPFEFMLNNLRLKNGFSLDIFERRTGISRSNIKSTLDKQLQMKLITVENSHVQPTQQGYKFIDSLLNDYLV